MEVFLTGVFLSCAFAAFKTRLPEKFQLLNIWRVVGGFILLYLSAWNFTSSAFGYNDAGHCTHIRTVFGSENLRCDIGWYFSGWGDVTHFPHYITVANSSDKNSDENSADPAYLVRLADNWSGKISQTTRFSIPHDREQFLRLAKIFPSPERLKNAILRPAVNASMDAVASAFSMEGYYSEGKRDEFKNAFQQTIRTGIERSGKSVTAFAASTHKDNNLVHGARMNNRLQHAFQRYGITVDLAVMHKLLPDSTYVSHIKDRKYATNKRILAKEKRMAEEEQRLLTIARQEIEIARQKTDALVNQAKRTTNAETEKIISRINAESVMQTAEIAINTAKLEFERARVDAETRKISAQSNAFERKAYITADGALNKKLEAYVTTNKAWADAFAKRAVPSAILGSGPSSTSNDAKLLMDIVNAKAAEDLNLDTTIKTHGTK